AGCAGERPTLRIAPHRAVDASPGAACTAQAPWLAGGSRGAPWHCPCRQPAGPSVRCIRAEPEVGRRFHVPVDGRGLAVRRGGAGPVLAARSRLVDAGQHDRATGYRCVDDGVVAAWTPAGVAAPFRPRQPRRNQAVVATSRYWRCWMGRPRGWATLQTGRAPMRSPGRPGINQREAKQAFWKRIAEGLTSEDAALVSGVSLPLGTRWFRAAGGMPPDSLAPLTGRYLAFAEREELAVLRAQGHGIREIARRLGRAPSTVSRELRRNAATRSGKVLYRATVAQWKAERAAARPKAAKLAVNERLRIYIQDRLAGAVTDSDGRPIPGPAVPRWKGRRRGRRADRRWGSCWSPEQISRRLPIDFPHDASMRVSHEAIYQALYVQGR